jgi:inhibitor of KinA sporulation pathway (predicted exonuclease)
MQSVLVGMLCALVVLAAKALAANASTIQLVCTIAVIAAALLVVRARRREETTAAPTSGDTFHLLSGWLRELVCLNKVSTVPRYLVVVDFECTCEQGVWDFKHEIIEFPAVLIDTSSGSLLEPRFHAYVRPTEKPKLSKFCTTLTGIEQRTVDEAETLNVVVSKFSAWLDDVIGENTYAMCADCSSDLRHFLLKECRRKNIQTREAWRQWVDVGRHLMVHCDARKVGNLQVKLARVGLAFEGTPHRGLDDARNVARLALALHERGVALSVNDGLARPKRPAVTKAERKARIREEEEAARRRRKPVVVDW